MLYRVRIAVLFGLVSVLIAVLVLRSQPEPDKLVLPSWTREPHPYTHLDLSRPLELPPTTKVLHVAKEFGPATMGGLGSMLSALVGAQAFSGLLEPAVVIPYYSFLKSSDIQLDTTVSVTVDISRNKPTNVLVPIYKLRWNVTSPSLLRANEYLIRAIDVYLIGKGDRSPFHVAFQAPDAGQIYSARRPLKQEWKDLYFAKAVAAFVLQQQGDHIVHLHGATNALVAYFLGPARPPTVYTLHDSLDEVEYSNLVSNFERFDSHTEMPMSRYVLGKRLYTSAIGIDLSDVTTFVSRTIARAVLEGGFEFALQELVMPSIYRKAKHGTFLGVSNGLDLSDSRKNPFTSPILERHRAQFSTASSKTNRTMCKANAKQVVVHALPSHFTQTDTTRPWLLFIGRFQYNKGCQFFEPLVRHLAAQGKQSAKLVAMGTHNNYPRQELRELARRYPDHFALLDEPVLQVRYGTLIRMASDVSFVPSFSEAFGLVAVEGLLFGMPVLTTGVGGLSEFIDPISSATAAERGNAYVFDLHLDLGKQSFGFSLEYARPNMTRLEPAVQSLLRVCDKVEQDWRERRQDEKMNELFTTRMVSDALKLAWDRPGGPVDEYAYVYDLALQRRKVRLDT